MCSISTLPYVPSGICQEELNPFPPDAFHDAPNIILPRAADPPELITSGSGSGSGSGGLLEPTGDAVTELTPVPAYDTTIFIRLTFNMLNQQQYRDDQLEERICNLITSLLKLDSCPLIIFDVKSTYSTILVYFPAESITTRATLESYVQTLGSTNNSEWIHVSDFYVSGLDFTVPFNLSMYM